MLSKLAPFLYAPLVLILMGAGNTNLSTTLPQKLTYEKKVDMYKNIGVIQTKHGLFRRTNKTVLVPQEQMVCDLDKVTSSTKAILTTYGVFVRTQ